MDANFGRFSLNDDHPWSLSLLRRLGSGKKCSGHHYAEFYYRSPHKHSVGPLGLQSCVWTGRGWNCRQPDWFGLNGVGTEPNADYAATIPHQTFMVYQMMFAVITPALITGAFAERVKFGAFLVFILLWATFIYDPLAHSVWGVKGWMREMGALDFAGGTVVHISSGVSALVAALMFGRRIGYGQEAMPPQTLPPSVSVA